MPHETQVSQSDFQQVVSPGHTEPLDLDLQNEVTAEGLSKEDLREEILADYAHKRRTATECFDLYDRFQLWEARKSDFWATYFEGVRASRKKYGEQDTHRRVA